MLLRLLLPLRAQELSPWRRLTTSPMNRPLTHDELTALRTLVRPRQSVEPESLMRAVFLPFCTYHAQLPQVFVYCT